MVKGRGAAAPGILEGSNGAAPAYDSTPTKGATGAMVSARRGRSAAANDSEPRRRTRVDRYLTQYQPMEWAERAPKRRRRNAFAPLAADAETMGVLDAPPRVLDDVRRRCICAEPTEQARLRTLQLSHAGQEAFGRATADQRHDASLITSAERYRSVLCAQARAPGTLIAEGG